MFVRALAVSVVGFGFLILVTAPADAKITFSPYVSIKSTKSIKPVAKDKSKETETNKQKQESGLRAGVRFWKLFSLQLGIGQSKLTTTEKVQDAKDEYGDIDYEKDLNMSTDNPELDVTITETQRNAKVSLILDPGFWIFIMRAKIGVTARQRILEKEQTGLEKTTLVDGPRYFAHSGFGLGIKFTPRFYGLIEYNFEHYKFPKAEPFERELAVSFAISI